VYEILNMNFGNWSNATYVSALQRFRTGLSLLCLKVPLAQSVVSVLQTWRHSRLRYSAVPSIRGVISPSALRIPWGNISAFPVIYL